MGTAGAIFNVPQTYGNGEVYMKGGFTDNGTSAVVAHGVGWQVVRGVTAGVYKVTLTPAGNTSLAFRSLLSGDVKQVVPASNGDTTVTNPGASVLGDLQPDGKTLYIYTYNTGAVQAYLATNIICEFWLAMSTSSLNQ